MSNPVIPALREFAQLPLLESGEGAELFLSLVRTDGSRLSTLLGTGESVALAGDLIESDKGPLGRRDGLPAPGFNSANRT